MKTRIPDEVHVTAFVKANDKSPVVEASVLKLHEGGGVYHLEDGNVFKLYVEECRLLPEGYPKWKGAP